MAFWSGLFGKKRRGKRSTKREMLARRRQNLKDLVELKRLERELADIEAGESPGDLVINLTDLPALQKKLGPAGLSIVPRNGATSESQVERILTRLLDSPAGGQIGAGIGMLIANAANQRADTPEPTPQPAQQAELPFEQPPLLEAPEPEPEQREVKMSIVSRMAIGQLQSKSPEAAAAFLQGLPIPKLQEVLTGLRQTPDEHIPLLLGQIVQSEPDLAGLIQWLRQRPDWLMQLVRALRGASAAAPPAPATRSASPLGL